MFGLDHTSGVEIPENDPQLSDTDPERSAMGQGTHQYTNVQLSRHLLFPAIFSAFFRYKSDTLPLFSIPASCSMVFLHITYL